MATVSALMTIEQYLHTPYSPDVDFVCGEIHERNVGERDHARLQSLIAAIFVAQEETLGVLSCTEQRIRVAVDRVRICDFTLIRANAPYEDVLVTAPLVCIEIMSPEDRLSRTLSLLEDYRAMGVPNIWLIDPNERLTYRFGADGLRQQQDLHLKSEDALIHLDVSALFQKLDQSKNKENA